jgi:hypothetical protein
MCGRYRRKSDKQKIADAFRVSAGLDELDLGPDDDIAPGSMQPVVLLDENGERQLELMRWGFKLPDRLLFNARSEGIDSSKFWKEAFLKGRVIVPADRMAQLPSLACDESSCGRRGLEDGPGTASSRELANHPRGVHASDLVDQARGQ